MEKGYRFGLTQRDLFTLIILQELQKGFYTGKDMYVVAVKKLPEKERGLQEKKRPPSRNQFYVTLRELESMGHIYSTSVGKQRYKDYALSSEGQQRYEWYRTVYYEKFSILKGYIDILFMDSKTDKVTSGAAEPLEPELRAYISRCLNVNELCRFAILKHLLHRKNLSPAGVRELMKTRYGWLSSEGYFYEIVHKMEEEGLIEGRWEDTERRRYRNYKITETGSNVYPLQAESVQVSIKSIRDFLASVIALFDTDAQHKEEDISK